MNPVTIFHNNPVAQAVAQVFGGNLEPFDPAAFQRIDVYHNPPGIHLRNSPKLIRGTPHDPAGGTQYYVVSQPKGFLGLAVGHVLGETTEDDVTIEGTITTGLRISEIDRLDAILETISDKGTILKDKITAPTRQRVVFRKEGPDSVRMDDGTLHWPWRHDRRFDWPNLSATALPGQNIEDIDSFFERLLISNGSQPRNPAFNQAIALLVSVPFLYGNDNQASAHAAGSLLLSSLFEDSEIRAHLLKRGVIMSLLQGA